MIPYAFSALTMNAVGQAANEMIAEIQDQHRDPDVRNGVKRPDYNRCIAISTKASLKKMIAPGLLVIGSPFVVGVLFGPIVLCGTLGQPVLEAGLAEQRRLLITGHACNRDRATQPVSIGFAVEMA